MAFLRLCRVATLLLTTLSCLACGSIPSHPTQSSVRLDEEETEINHGAALIEGMLLFLNDESTTVGLLDITVDLDHRVAKGIIAHRDGNDEVLGTEDDDLFESICEIDSIEWVGPKTIQRIKEYAIENGWVPEEDPFLGVYDGVTFTVLEAEAVLVLVNESSLEALDAIIDHRAAETIVDQRPFDSIRDLSAVKWIGPDALLKLKLVANASQLSEGL